MLIECFCLVQAIKKSYKDAGLGDVVDASKDLDAVTKLAKEEFKEERSLQQLADNDELDLQQVLMSSTEQDELKKRLLEADSSGFKFTEFFK